MAIVCVAWLTASGCTTGTMSPGGTTSSNTLDASFRELAATIPATVGLVVVPVGGTPVSAFGAWSTGVAWSTIKVPLALAALRVEDASAYALAVRAITESDNTAAERLWSGLGPPDKAARRVQAILREGGDTRTVVESRRLRPGFTAFGQTRWTLDQQARFAAHLPCIAGAGTVVDLMHDLVEEQRWGLAADGGPAKGGWGPGLAGGYLVRQFGIVATPAGQLGVALAAEPRDGTFHTGVAALDRMTQWLDAHKTELPGGGCAAP